MAYNLPDAWDPGYVLPKNVQDEGLERRAFVTKQMPRGTYDQPTVGTGGYAVPRYVMDEGYGQGTFTTKWQPSGSYAGPKVPHWLNQRPKVVRERRLPGGGRVVTVQPLSDDQPLPAPFESYGARAATMLIGQVGSLPAGQRAKALRQILDGVDKSLWSRTQDIWRRYRAQGIPPDQAFPRALARAMSAGIAAEIVATGLRRSAPQAQSLLGLGCYGCSAVLGAMGAVTMSTGFSTGMWTAPAPSTTAIRLPVVPVPPTVPVEVGGFTFDPRTLTRAWAAASAPSATAANRQAPPDAQIDDPAKLPQATIDFLRNVLLATNPNEPTRSFASTNAMTGFPEWDASTWFAALGIDAQTKLRQNPLWWFRQAVAPFARVKNPLTGQDMVLHLSLAKRDYNAPADPTTNPLVLKAWLSTIPDPTLWQSIWDSMVWLPMHTLTPLVAPVITPVVKAGIDAAGATVDAVKIGLNKLGELACDLLSTPGVGAAAGAAGGVIAGVPPQAGAAAGQAGAQIAKDACGATPPPAPPPVVPQHSILPLALLGGAAVVALALYLSHKETA